MAYEHTVVNPFAMPGGRTYAIGDKITDEAEAEAIYARHFGRNLSRHDVTTAPEAPEKAVEPVSEPKPAVAAAKPIPAPAAAAAPPPAASTAA